MDKLATKFVSYKSFKITLQGVTFSDSLNVENWPEGLIVKRYFTPKQSIVVKDKQVDSASKNLITNQQES